LTQIFSDIYFDILFFEPDTKSMQHKHTLSAQHRLVITDTEHSVMTLLVGSQDNRHLFTNSYRVVQHYVQNKTRTSHVKK